MENKEIFNEASLSEGGGRGGNADEVGGSSPAQSSAKETPSVCPAGSQLPHGGSLDPTPPECEGVGGDVPDAPTTDSTPPGEEEPNAPRTSWDIDLNREEFVAFRMLMSRLVGPLRQRIPTLVVSVLCFLMLVGYALFEWWAGWVTSPDPVLLVGGALVLIPALVMCLYAPYHLRRNGEKHYDRSVEAGVTYFGELTVYPDCVEKVGQVMTAHLRIDERLLFVETPEMMLLFSSRSPAAIVIPARCATDEMARAVRQAMDKLPPRNRKFFGRIQPLGEPVVRPAPKAKPEELWVNTFTYTAAEYAVVLKGIIQQHFWRMAPLLAAVSMMGALAFGYDGESLTHCIWYFLAFITVLIVLNLVLPIQRIKSQTETLSAHDRTVQVRIDTMALRMKLPKGAEEMVLWCDVDHVYEREDFVEIVHNKRASLFIPKRCIDDLDALDRVIQRCKGKQ